MTKVQNFPLTLHSRGIVLGQDPDSPLCRTCENPVDENEGELCAHCGEIAHPQCLVITGAAEKLCKTCAGDASETPGEDD